MESKRLITIIILILGLLMSGCWSRTEIENLAIVTGIGIDVVENNGQEKFLLTANIIRPALAGGGTEGGGGSAGKPVYWRVSSYGDNFSEAERNLNLRIPRQIFYGHLRFVLINRKAASRGLADVFDYLHRNMRTRPRVLILMAQGRAFDTLINQPELETNIARQIEELSRFSVARSSKAYITDLANTTGQMIAPGIDPVIAVLAPIEESPAEPGGKPVKVFRINRGGAFRVDKFVGWLDSGETRGYLLGIGKAKSGPFPVKLRPHFTKDVNIMMNRASGDIKADVHGDEVTAKIEIRAEGDLSEYHETDEIATNEGMKMLEKKFGEAIKAEVMSAVKKSKELKSDFFGFGEELHRSNPAEWKKLEKQWYDIIPKIKVTVRVTANVRRTGMIADPFKPE